VVSATFGDVLRRYRRQLGLTQEELAAVAGVNVRSIGKLEAGLIAAPRSATIRLLADAIGLSGMDRDRFRRAAAPVQEHAARFIGRADTLRSLSALLTTTWPRTMPIVAIAGDAGVGKTALALHWAHRVRRRFVDGQLHVNLRGSGPAGSAMSAAEALRGLLGALGVPPHRLPAAPAAQTALYRSLLADRRMLVLLDNAHDAAQVRPLLPGASGCMALVTSRDPLPGLVAAEGAEPMTLEALSRTESIRLLADRLGADRVTDRNAVERIVERCAGLPLALEIVAARAATHPSLADLASTLPDNGDTVIDWAYRALSPDAATLFRLFGTHPGDDLTAPAAASMAGLPVTRTRALLTELTDAHLVTEPVSGRFTCHDLLRGYAATLDGADDRREATLRLVDHYLHTAYAGARLLQPRRGMIVLDPPPPETVPEPIADADQALAWFTAEHAVLLAAVGHAARHRLDARTWQLAWTLEPFLSGRGFWQDWAASQSTALGAAQRSGDLAAQARAHRAIGRARMRLGLDQDALRHLNQAVALSRRYGDRDGQARTHHTIARLHDRHGAHDEALRHTERALELYEATGQLLGQARSLNAIGWQHALRGHYRRAIEHCTQALGVLLSS
jgi:transcriptional regulator with XRE-family HTH domain/tetratricopeptide (TPR) repeat protein